jgi:hypothetical protein
MEYLVESCIWFNANHQKPESSGEFLICYQHNDSDKRGVAIGHYDQDEIDDDWSEWEVDGGLTEFGKVLYWSPLPTGPLP